MAQVRVRVDVPGLLAAERMLAAEFARAAQKVGEELQSRIRPKQSHDTGQNRRRTQIKVVSRTGARVSVSVYNTTIQANVDETGAKPHFPPFKIGSKLFRWVQRKGISSRITSSARASARRFGQTAARAAGANNDDARAAGRAASNRAAMSADKKTQSIAFLIARAQSRRGLPRPGVAIKQPFAIVARQSVNFVQRSFDFAAALAVVRINRGTR